jgi:hypothetical protein
MHGCYVEATTARWLNSSKAASYSCGMNSCASCARAEATRSCRNKGKDLSRLPTSGLLNIPSVQPGPSGRSNDRNSTTPQNSLRWL